MYNPIDRHGLINCTDTFFTYSPDEWYNKYKELEKKYEKLEERIKKYEDLKKDNNINVIDGKICYRELKNVSVDSVDMDNDFVFHLSMSGIVVYKDVDTDKIMGTREFKVKVNNMEDNEECIEL